MVSSSKNRQYIRLVASSTITISTHFGPRPSPIGDGGTDLAEHLGKRATEVAGRLGGERIDMDDDRTLLMSIGPVRVLGRGSP